MLIFFVSILGFVPFSFPISTNHIRIQVTSLLILTSVNFRWIITKNLPTISYLTTLDKYGISALIFLVALCAWHGIISSSIKLDNSRFDNYTIDTIVLIIFAILFVLFHVIYILVFHKKYNRYKHVGKQAIQFEVHSNIGELQTIY